MNEFFWFFTTYKNADDFYLTINWINNANSVIFFNNDNIISTYEKFVKYFNVKNKKVKLFVIFNYIKNTINIWIVMYENSIIENFVKLIFKIKIEKNFVKKKINFNQKKNNFELKKNVLKINIMFCFIRNLY